MKYDAYGQSYTTTDELCSLLYANPKLDINLFEVEDPQEFNASIQALHVEMNLLNCYTNSNSASVEEFDIKMQQKWRMPKEYLEMDIAEYILSLCREDYEFQRVGQELFLYQERNLFDLLRYLKYLVDVARKNNIVWGVGRGSSVASYILYLLTVHRIDSIYYDLDISEFLKS